MYSTSHVWISGIRHNNSLRTLISMYRYVGGSLSLYEALKYPGQ